MALEPERYHKEHMDFKTIAENLFPYWLLGVMVVLAVICAGQKHLLRVEKKPIINWMVFLAFITALRFLLTKLMNFNGIGSPNTFSFLPWYVSLTVFWEDMCHGLPLVILKKLIGTKWWTKFIHLPLLALVMIEFGLGHAYQGIFAIVLLGFYVPYSMRIGEKYGFGTLVLCHMLYDAVTLLFVQYIIGA